MSEYFLADLNKGRSSTFNLSATYIILNRNNFYHEKLLVESQKVRCRYADKGKNQYYSVKAKQTYSHPSCDRLLVFILAI